MITKSFLADVAEYTDRQIQKVVLNESLEITDFVAKQISESTLALQYIVPVASVALITKIELKDSNDAVISANDVYVPITSDTVLLQTISIKEG